MKISIKHFDVKNSFRHILVNTQLYEIEDGQEGSYCVPSIVCDNYLQVERNIQLCINAQKKNNPDQDIYCYVWKYKSNTDQWFIAISADCFPLIRYALDIK